MKLRKILSSIIAGAMAVSAMAFSASAVVKMTADVGKFDGDNFFIDLVESRINYEEVSTVVVTLQSDTIMGFNGGIMFNGKVCGWKQLSENNYGDPDGTDPLKAEKTGDDTYVLKVSVPAAVWGTADMAYDDGFYAQFFMQQWSGDPLCVKSVEFLDASGNPVSALPEPPAAEEDDAEEDDAAAAEEDDDDDEAADEDADDDDDEDDDEAADEDDDDDDEDDDDEAADEDDDDEDDDDDDDEASYLEPLTLNCNDPVAKIAQFPTAKFGETLDELIIVGKVPAADDGWIGGGGGMGFNNGDGDWVQIDKNLGDEGTTVNNETGEVEMIFDYAATGKNTTLGTADDSIVQLGWWWGSGDGTIAISDIFANGVSLITGKPYAKTVEAVEAPAAEEEDSAAPAETTTTAPAAGNVDAATDSSKGSPDTGVADVAVVAGLAIVAAGAVLVSKKRK